MAAAVLATTLSLADFAGADIASAAIARAKSFVELMSQRSPGQRIAGALTKKHKHYRVLATHVIPEIPPPVLTGSLVDVAVPPVELLPGGLEVADLTPPPGGIVFPPPLVPCCDIIPPPPHHPPTPPPPVFPPLPGLPEPGTWLTMILGFGMAGWTLRRQRTLEGLRSGS